MKKNSITNFIVECRPVPTRHGSCNSYNYDYPRELLTLHGQFVSYLDELGTKRSQALENENSKPETSFVINAIFSM